MRIRIIDSSYYTSEGKPARYPKLWVTGLTAIHLAGLCGGHDVDVKFDVFGDLDFDEPVDLVALTAMAPQLIRAPGLLDLARDSGCGMLSIGFESINQRSLRSVAKGFNRVEDYRRVIDAIMCRGIHVNALTMFGLDDDHEDVFARTADFFASAGVSLLDCFILVPMPGTRMFDRLKLEGRLLTEDFRKYDVTNVVYQPEHMSPERLRRGLWESFERFYRRRSIAKRMAMNWRSSYYAWLWLFGLNVFYRRLAVGEHVKHPNVWHAPYA